MMNLFVQSRCLVTIAALSFLVWGITGSAAAEDFVPGTEDVPLMAGLQADEAAGMSFDTPSGRIVVTVATGGVTSLAVREFYRKALPGLGWAARSGVEFTRGGEVLRIESEPIEGSSLKVTFTLSPMPDRR